MNILTTKRIFSEIEPALCQAGAVSAGIVAGTSLAATYWPSAVGYAAACVSALALLELALWLAQKLLRYFLGHSLGWLMGLGLLYGSLAYTVKRGAGEGWTWRVLVFSGIAAAALGTLAVSWWSVLRWRRRGAAAVMAAVSAGAVSLLAVFLFTSGFDDSYIHRYLALAHHQETASPLEEGPGPWQVRTLDYGPDTALEAGTVNLTAYMSRDTGDLTGNYVDAYWDYELNEVPLKGRVWYPADKENCPALFIAHGNHEIATESYLGYAYLGEYLASHGYVVASVDQNACNMLTNENDGRAVLLLEHIGFLLDSSGKEGNPLYGKIDPDNLAVAGHSRGGEMAATAYLFNHYSRYPENGEIVFDYGYNIKSIIAIAPTADQYRPADHSVALEDVNYLLLHGAADRDVTSFMGMAQYENISFTGKGRFLKTALYIAGANHGQFNSLWGAYDQSGPFAPLLNVESLLTEEEQQKIVQLFIKTFLDVTLAGNRRHEDLLTDWDTYGTQLPETVYVQCWESSGFVPIADFEEDSDLETGTMEGTTLSAAGTNLWTEELAGFGGRDTHALRLRWTGAGSYTASFPALDLTGKAVSFDICDLDSQAVKRGDLALVDGEIILKDEAGSTATAKISDYTVIFPILPVRTDKLDFLFDTCVYKKAFATAAISAGAFQAESEIDLSKIVELTFRFTGSGQILMDNIGIEPAG